MMSLKKIQVHPFIQNPEYPKRETNTLERHYIYRHWHPLDIMSKIKINLLEWYKNMVLK